MANGMLQSREAVVTQLAEAKGQLRRLHVTSLEALLSAREQVPIKPSYSTISTSTSLRTAIKELANQARIFNLRIDTLRRQGEDVPEGFGIDLGQLFLPFVSNPRSTETAGWTFVKALPAFEGSIRLLCHGLIKIEDLHMLLFDRLNDLLSECIQFEQMECVREWYAQVSLTERLEQALAAALSPDAVWLDDPKEQLAISKHVLATAQDYREVSAACAAREFITLHVLCQMAKLGLRVKRQRIITEYFDVGSAS